MTNDYDFNWPIGLPSAALIRPATVAPRDTAAQHNAHNSSTPLRSPVSFYTKNGDSRMAAISLSALPTTATW